MTGNMLWAGLILLGTTVLFQKASMVEGAAVVDKADSSNNAVHAGFARDAGSDGEENRHCVQTIHFSPCDENKEVDIRGFTVNGFDLARYLSVHCPEAKCRCGTPYTLQSPLAPASLIKKTAISRPTLSVFFSASLCL